MRNSRNVRPPVRCVTAAKRQNACRAWPLSASRRNRACRCRSSGSRASSAATTSGVRISLKFTIRRSTGSFFAGGPRPEPAHAVDGRVERGHRVATLGEPERVAAVAGADVDDPAAGLDPLADPVREVGRLGRQVAARLGLVEVVPVPQVGPPAAHPPVGAAHGAGERGELEGRVRDLPPLAVRQGEQLLGAGRAEQLEALEGDRRDRDQRRAVDGAGDVGHQVEHVVDEVAAEHVDAAAAAVGEVDPDLEVGLAHPHDLPAELLHPPGRGVVLADDVERVGVRAHVGQVGVGVVADHVPVAHRAEQAAEREERLQPALLAEVVQHPLHRLDDQRLGVAVGVGEAALHPAALVDRELVARRVRDADPVGRRAEADLVVEEDLLAHVRAYDDARDAAEVRLERRVPGDGASLGGGGAVTLGVEGPDPVPVQEDVEGVDDPLGDGDAPRVHAYLLVHPAPARPLTAAIAHGRPDCRGSRSRGVPPRRWAPTWNNLSLSFVSPHECGL